MSSADLQALGLRITSRLRETAAGCLEWRGAKDARGYGVMRVGGRTVRTHRAMMAVATNNASLLAKPVGNLAHSPLYVLHSCDNPACCNPAHLRLGSSNDNTADMLARNRMPAFNPGLPRKLTPADVQEIRAVAVDWDGFCDMMKKHRVGQLAIQQVLSRKTYKHVP